MFGGWHEGGWVLLSLLLIGAAIKLMDDFLDVEFDLWRGQRTLAGRLGRASLPYCLLCGLVAAFVEPHLTLALFLASYAVGMFTTWREHLPSGVPAFVEIVLAIGLSWICVGWQIALWAFSMMAVIDWLDDLVDSSGDKLSGQNNMAVRIGFVETLFLILAALCTAVLTNVFYTVLTFVALTILTLLSEVTTKHLWKATKGEDSR